MTVQDHIFYDYTARVQMALESANPFFESKVLIYPKLRFGPRLAFHTRSKYKETELVLSHDREVDEEIRPTSVNTIPASVRNFIGIELYALMDSVNDEGIYAFEIQPSKTDAFQCDIDAPHPGHLVDENGVWTLTDGRNGWCKGRGDVG